MMKLKLIMPIAKKKRAKKMNRYIEMQMFFNTILEFVFENPDKKIDNRFIYSLMCGYYSIDNLANFDFGSQRPVRDNYYQKWIDRYANIKKRNNVDIDVFPSPDQKFLIFSSGYIKDNEIKMYIPLDYNHIYEGANRLFDFITANKITHNSKIANFIRSDNVVVRVDKLADMEKIINFVINDAYIQEGMLKVNPFLENYNGIGLAMDNSYSYNYETAKLIADFLNKVLDDINYYSYSNELSVIKNVKNMFTIENFHDYLEKVLLSLEKSGDEDLIDIIILLFKTTIQNFTIADFYDHVNEKLVDKYDACGEKIADPLYYLERAININSIFYPGKEKESLKQLINNNYELFTSKEHVRDTLLKYIAPFSKREIINIMKDRLKQYNIYFSMFSKREEILSTFVDVTIKENQGNVEYQNIRERKKIGYYDNIQNFQSRKNHVNHKNEVYENFVKGDYKAFIFYDEQNILLTMNEKFNILKRACLNISEKDSQFLPIILLELAIHHQISPYFMSGDRDYLKNFIDEDIKAIMMYGINVDNLDTSKIDVIIKRFIDEINLEKSKTRKF